MSTQKRLKQLFLQLAEEYKEATSVSQAKRMGRDTFITLDHNTVYKGYRLERAKTEGHSVKTYCFGMHSSSGRYTTKEMIIYLEGYLNATQPDFR